MEKEGKKRTQTKMERSEHKEAGKPREMDSDQKRMANKDTAKRGITREGINAITRNTKDDDVKDLSHANDTSVTFTS